MRGRAASVLARWWAHRWHLAAVAVAGAVAAAGWPWVWRDADVGIAAVGAHALLVGGPVVAWLGLARVARFPVAVLLTLNAAAFFVASQVFPGATLPATPGSAWQTGDAIAPPAADWVLPAGWLGTGLCAAALLLHRLRWRPAWPDLGPAPRGLRLRRTVGAWALAGAVFCGVDAWSVTPYGIPHAFGYAVAAAEGVPVPGGWTVLADDRTCRRSQGQCAHPVWVRVPPGTSGSDARAVLRGRMWEAGWTAQCRPMRGIEDWPDRCLHLYAAGAGGFVIVVDERASTVCDKDDLLAPEPPTELIKHHPDVGCGVPTFVDPWLVQQLDHGTRRR
jgi:hypothetical protein